MLLCKLSYFIRPVPTEVEAKCGPPARPETTHRRAPLGARVAVRGPLCIVYYCTCILIYQNTTWTCHWATTRQHLTGCVSGFCVCPVQTCICLERESVCFGGRCFGAWGENLSLRPPTGWSSRPWSRKPPVQTCICLGHSLAPDTCEWPRQTCATRLHRCPGNFDSFGFGFIHSLALARPRRLQLWLRRAQIYISSRPLIALIFRFLYYFR
jgi:hypothetical protein